MLTNIQIACMTPKTRLQYDGAKITRPDHSIHPYGKVHNTCKPTIRANGAKAKVLKRLAARVKDYEATVSIVRIRLGFTKPGSMTK